MQTVHIAQLIITDRQRGEILPKPLLDLKRSILSKGLLHAPVISLDGTTHRLVAGERRVRAMQELHAEGHTFTYNSLPVPEGHIPFVTIQDLSPVELWEAELEENILRQPLTWMEEATALAKIHQARLAANPNQTVLATATELATLHDSTPTTERKKLAAAILIDKNKHNPRVHTAKSFKDAHRAVLDQAETFFKAELARRATVLKTTHQAIHGNCLEVLKTFKPHTFDLIISDPPYGIKADANKTEHFYDDSTEVGLQINKHVLSEGFNITKPKALIFLFCDIEHFTLLRDWAAQQAWAPWRTPLIWYKSSNTGHAPWGKAGFLRNYECILFASKGQKELHKGRPSDVITHIPSLTNAAKQHAAEKPVELLSYLLSLSTLPGDTVLDPCCGSGTIFPAAEQQRVKATGIEIDKTYFDQATVKIGNLYAQDTKD